MGRKGEFCNVGCESNNGLVSVPCTSSEECWSAIEHDSFILGLYIFGKNLRVVNKFMGDKDMPNVISYYYGKFYRSSEHQNWSMYQKKRIKKSLPGKKIFRGWRLQELLSRLLSNVTGLDLLVQAVAIGKGKQDLTMSLWSPHQSSHRSHIMA
ncbi:putative transcription regulator Homeodomain-LIKE family [Helianthus debilis subsp. tardiflorus]